MSLNEEYCQDEPYHIGDVIGALNEDYTLGFEHEVLGKLGEGGFGVVYLVREKATDKKLAVKILHDYFSKDADARAAFLREADVLVDMEHHSNIVNVNFVLDTNNRIHIFMEPVEKNEQGLNTLEGYLKYKKPVLAQVLRWAIQFCHGMEYANAKGMKCHRDIKPQNIMIAPDGTLKISDFGLVGIANPVSQVDIELSRLKSNEGPFQIRPYAVGTPTHMSPEQFMDYNSCDVRSDIYSFGIVLYQMVNDGSPPFPIPTMNDRSEMLDVMRVLHTDVPLPPIESPIFPIIQRCLEKESDKRYQSFTDLRQDLENKLRTLYGEQVPPPTIIQPDMEELGEKGNSLAIMRQFDKAIKYYKRLLKMMPDSILALNGLGICYSHKGKPKKALQYYMRTGHNGKYPSFIMNGIAGCYLELKDYEKADAFIDGILDANENDYHAWRNKGEIQAAQGYWWDAIQYCKKAIELNPAYFEAWWIKGTCEYELRMRKDAIISLKKFLSYVPVEYDKIINNANELLQILEDDSIWGGREKEWAHLSLTIRDPSDVFFKLQKSGYHNRTEKQGYK